LVYVEIMSDDNDVLNIAFTFLCLVRHAFFARLDVLPLWGGFQQGIASAFAGRFERELQLFSGRNALTNAQHVFEIRR